MPSAYSPLRLEGLSAAVLCRATLIELPARLRAAGLQSMAVHVEAALASEGPLAELVAAIRPYVGLPEGELPEGETLIERAVRQNGLALMWVPEPWKTPELCDLAVRENAMALEFVPRAMANEILCRTAVRQDPEALRFVPARLRSNRLCSYAVERDPCMLACAEEAYRTRERVLAAVRRNGCALRGLGYPWNTDPEVCRAAVEQNGLALEFVSWPMTEELCDLALAQTPEAIKLVPRKWRSAERIERVLAVAPHLLMEAPAPMLTNERVDAALAADPEVYENLAGKWRTAARRKRLLATHPEAVAYDLKPQEFTEELAWAMVEKAPWTLSLVPEALRSEALCDAALAGDPWRLRDLPPKLLIAERIRAALRQNGRVLGEIPEPQRPPYYEIALASDGRALSEVPEGERTPALCALALSSHGMALRDVPLAVLRADAPAAWPDPEADSDLDDWVPPM